MTNQQKAALYEDVKELLNEIDSICKDYGYDLSDFDEDIVDDITDANEFGYFYQHVHRLKTIVDA